MEEKILRCVKILNKIYPGWRNKIQTKLLDLQNPQRCIFGQIFGHYEAGLERFRREGFDESAPYLYGVSLRFDECNIKNWERLNDEWVKVLQKIPVKVELRKKRVRRLTRTNMSL